MASASVELRIDRGGLAAALSGAEAQAVVNQCAQDIASRATSSGAGFRTKRRYKDGVLVAGDKQPSYGAHIKLTPDGGAVGIAYTANYAAILHNSVTNALLKAAR